MQLDEIRSNIAARRDRIFLLMEELRRLRIQQRLKVGAAAATAAVSGVWGMGAAAVTGLREEEEDPQEQPGAAAAAGREEGG
jgi:hypothetical protein